MQVNAPCCKQMQKQSTNDLSRERLCDHCKQQGYQGRTGVYELIAVDDKMRELIHSRVSEAELTAYARTKGPSIRDDGRARILAGETTVEEVLRVTQEE
jgi:general secretion pathway protein E